MSEAATQTQMEHAPGSFCWAELATTDGPGAKKFYSELFGWTTHDSPVGPGMVYTMLKLDGKDVGALYEKGEMMKDVPTVWASYISVANADEIAAKAKSLGGTVMKEPFEPNSVCWNELLTTDSARAIDFYTKLFGWKADTHGGPVPYTEWKNGDEHAGGMMQIQPHMGPMPPHWGIYFAVDDCDATFAKATSLGATPFVPPMDIENVGRFSTMADPQGAVFAIIRLTPHHEEKK